jgi:hypothetical protein
VSRERESRQRKRQGYSTRLPPKAPIQGPARPHKDKWAELAFYKKSFIQMGAAFTALGCLWLIDAAASTHFFSPPAWVGIGLYTAWRLWTLKKETK